MGEKDHSDRQLVGDGTLTFVPLAAIRRVRAEVTDRIARAEILADVCRVNTLYMIMNAGSGHIGSSFSSTDIITWLWTEELTEANSGAPNADTYFSSKGNDELGEITVIVDHNRYQSDSTVAAVSDLGPIEDKFRAFGWEVRRLDGHDLRALSKAFRELGAIGDRPKVIIADTIKGRGVSFM